MTAIYTDELAAVGVALEYMKRAQREISEDIGSDVQLDGLKIIDANGEVMGTIEFDGETHYFLPQVERDI